MLSPFWQTWADALHRIGETFVRHGMEDGEMSDSGCRAYFRIITQEVSDEDSYAGRIC